MAAKIVSFRKMLQRSLLLDKKENQLFDQIPDAIIEGIFRHNFNGSLATAERVLFNRYSEVEDTDLARLEQEKLGIHNLVLAATRIRTSLKTGIPVLFVTDNDNDGSLAQAILMEFVQALPSDEQKLIHVEYAQPIGHSRGLTYEVTELAVNARHWSSDQPFTLVTADNGINNSSEVVRIQEAYPNAFVIITDHHLPSKDVVVENDRALIFNPKYNPTPYFKRKNISGANTLGVLLTAVLPPKEELTIQVQRYTAAMSEIGSWANLLDYANADIADMPNRPYVMEKALQLRPLLNVSNSMNTLVTGTHTDADIAAISAATNGAITPEWIQDRLTDVRMLNNLARKLLTLYHRFENAAGDGLNENGFYAELSAELEREDDGYTSINPNYIEQLRPIIFNLAAKDAKNVFLAKTEATMVELFDTLRDQEKAIQEGLRAVGLLRQDRRPNSSILYPIDPSVTKVFNRKLLGKAYNQDNNGFLLILSKVDVKEASGSMRSLYPMSEILENKAEIEKKLGVDIDFQGHEMAAGFFVRARGKTRVDEAVLSKLNVWLDERIHTLKAAEKINAMPNIELDFPTVDLINKVNRAVKANLAGMWGVPSIIRFSPDKDDQVWVTDSKTTEQISLAEVVKRKRYGYQAIATNFDGGAFVVPIELLRTIVESKYKKALRLSYMDEGVFIGNQVVEASEMPELVPVKGSRNDQKELGEYYDEHFGKDHFMDISREDFKNIPYFKYNRYGDQEFEQWEALVINMLDRSGRDVLSVVDTEGTGLGKAPKCLNIGGTNIKIADGSGARLDIADFEKHLFRDVEGHEFLLSHEQHAALMDINDDEDEESLAKLLVKENTEEPMPFTTLYSSTIDRGMETTRVIYPGEIKDLTPIHNRKVDEETGQVLFNRTIDGFAFAFLVANNDFAITPEFADLTGLSNGMVKSKGKPAKAVDKELTDRLQAMKNDKGEPAKFIFQAHNMPYDKGVVSANFQNLNKMMDDHVTSDTAKIARREKLAYDDTPVCTFEGIAGLPPKTYFYDSPYSTYSMTTFLDRIDRTGKGGVFPDINAKLLLRYDPSTERFSVIDREANQEVLLDTSLQQLRSPRGETVRVDGESGLSSPSGARITCALPNNAVKYSVERMSSRAMIRNILLFEKLDLKMAVLEPEEAVYRTRIEMFQRNYHFDSTLDQNIEDFTRSLFPTDTNSDFKKDVKLQDVGARFLRANREIQARFHDAWIYEKVLNHYEPSVTRINLTAAEVEQINYFTDLPNKKIREVCKNIVEFKRHFKIEHALVHEQHNNIRMKSEDGQGLADTVYECVLPQFLGMMKFKNPYYRSIEPAAAALINQNFLGSMVQHMVNDNFKAEIARDSYSMKQMMAFRRQGNTDTINRAKRLASGADPESREKIKFKLAADVLPPDTAIYGKPRRHLSQEEVLEVSELLNSILVNEQVKSAAMLGSLDHAHAIRSVALAQANDDQSIAKRDRIMELFEKIEFSKRDGEVTKLAKMMKEAVEDGQQPKLPRGFSLSDEMIEVAGQMIKGLDIVYGKINMGDKDTQHLHDFYAAIKESSKAVAEKKAAAAPKDEAKAEAERERVKAEFGISDIEVRNSNFLPEMDITRREPFKFMIKHTGLANCLPLLREQADRRALEEAARGPAPETPSEAAKPKAKRRRRVS